MSGKTQAQAQTRQRQQQPPVRLPRLVPKDNNKDKDKERPRIRRSLARQPKSESLAIEREKHKSVTEEYIERMSLNLDTRIKLALGVDGSESIVSSNRDEQDWLGGENEENDNNNGLFRQKTPGDKELTTILFASHHQSVLKWKKSIGAGGKDTKISYADDELIESQIVQIMGKADGSVFIQIPKKSSESLGIKFPYFNMIIRNLDCYFSFEIQILDNTGCKRTFKMSNFQTLVRMRMDCCSMPMRLDVGWNQIVIDLPAFVKDAFGTKYRETIMVKINANVFIRRIYFSSEVFEESVLPAEYRMIHLVDKRENDPIVRKRKESEPKELRMKDIVVKGPIKSRLDIVNGIFESTSGYIVIDEDNWDMPNVVTMDYQAVAAEMKSAEAERRKKSLEGDEISLKVQISPDHSERLKLLNEEADAEAEKAKNVKLMPQNSLSSLFESLSEIYDFIAGKPTGVIFSATGDTIDDLNTISESLKDMASFTGIWELKPKVRKEKPKKIVPEPEASKSTKGQRSRSRSQRPRVSAAAPRDVLITVVGFEPDEGIPIAPGPDLVSLEPSQFNLTQSLSKQVLDFAETLSRRSRSRVNLIVDELDEESAHAQAHKSALALPPAQVNCQDFSFQSYVSATLALHQFASLSSELLEKLESNPKFVKKLSEHFTVPKSKSSITKSTHSIVRTKSHLRKISLTLKDVASVTTLKALQLAQIEKQAAGQAQAQVNLDLEEMDKKTGQEYNQILEGGYGNLNLPHFKEPVEIFNSYSSDCCLITKKPPYLAKHSDSNSAEIQKKISGLSLLDSIESILAAAEAERKSAKSSIDAAAAADSNEPAISTKLIKTIKKASVSMLNNLSTEALEVLSEVDLGFMIDDDADRDLRLAHREACHAREAPSVRELWSHELAAESSHSLKYPLSKSELNIPFRPETAAQYEVKVKLSKDELKAEKIEPFLSYDAIPCESWADFFVPAKGQDCNLDLGSMSEIWDKFYGVNEEFAPGFALPRSPRPLTSTALSISSSSDDIASSSSSDSDCADPGADLDLRRGKKARKLPHIGFKRRLEKTATRKSTIMDIFAPRPEPTPAPAHVTQSDSALLLQPAQASHSISSAHFSVAPSDSLISLASHPKTIPASTSTSLISAENPWPKFPPFGENQNKKFDAKKIPLKPRSVQSSISDNDDADLSLKILKKMCIDALSYPPNQVLPVVPPADPDNWVPVPQRRASDSSDLGSSSDDDDDDEEDDQEKSKEPEVRVKKWSASKIFPNSSSGSGSTETLLMISPPCSVMSNSDEEFPRFGVEGPPPPPPSAASEGAGQGGNFYWGATPGSSSVPAAARRPSTISLSLSSKSSNDSGSFFGKIRKSSKDDRSGKPMHDALGLGLGLTDSQMKIIAEAQTKPRSKNRSSFTMKKELCQRS